MTKHKKNQAMPKIIIYKDKIIKVNQENENYYIGYDVLSETLCQLIKNKDAIVLPQAVIKLLGCEKSRLRLADSLVTTCKGVSELIGMSERNMYRYYKEFNLFPDDVIDADGKKTGKLKLVNPPVKKIKNKLNLKKSA